LETESEKSLSRTTQPCILMSSYVSCIHSVLAVKCQCPTKMTQCFIGSGYTNIVIVCRSDRTNLIFLRNFQTFETILVCLKTGVE